MSNIEGVPEGWELVAIRRARYMENYIWTSGLIVLWQERTESGFIVPIIRKIEKPATYRPFVNAEEYLPHWGKPICQKGGSGFDSVVSTSMIGVYVAATTEISYYSMADAFEQFAFADGTPFGVEVQ